MTDDHDLAPARDLIDFIEASPTPYHAAIEVARRLDAAGFKRLDERMSFKLEAGDRAYLVRGGGTIVAFVLGSAPPSETGFIVLGAHTDSPNFRIKPVPDTTSSGYTQVNVEIYGGALLSTWVDRDLSVAGRVALKDGTTRLIRCPEPVYRIPNLAIHLNREVNATGLLLNAQQHLTPVTGMDLGSQTAGLRALIARELDRVGLHGVSGDDVLAYDLCLFDTNRPAIGGSAHEFIFSARLDNLASCHAALTALLNVADDRRLTRVIALHDHEECGSQSASGARSRLLLSLLDRIATLASPHRTDATACALARSFFASTDMAHAVHPNYRDKHDPEHMPKINLGPVIKTNVNQSYATDAPGAALFIAACREAGFLPQHFVARNDVPCGSTIGPPSAARLGMRTLDIGSPMLSMHSCREMGGTSDVGMMIVALTELFKSSSLPDSAI